MTKYLLTPEGKLMFYDIETSPASALIFQTGKQHVDESQVYTETKIICICYKFEGERQHYKLAWDENQDDKKLLITFSKDFLLANTIAGHNATDFDLRTINARLAKHKLPPLPPVLQEDTLTQARGAFRLPSHRLNYLLRYFDLGSKIKTDFGLWKNITLYNDRKALDKMVKYCMRDVTELEKLWKYIRPYVKTKRNLAILSNDPNMCPSCGSHNVRLNGSVMTQTGQRRKLFCKDCNKYSQIGTNIVKNSRNFPR